MPLQNARSERSVLKDNAVFYINNGKVLSSCWGESKWFADVHKKARNFRAFLSGQQAVVRWRRLP